MSLLNNSNSIRPLTTKINPFNQKNTSNIFNDFSQKTNINFNGTQREFGKDITNQNNLTSFNKENFTRILVNKNNFKNPIKKDENRINEIPLNEIRRQRSQDNFSKNIFNEKQKENKQNYSSKNILNSNNENEDIQMEDLTENNNINNNNINNNNINYQNEIHQNLNIDRIIIDETIISKSEKEEKKEKEEKLEDIEMKNEEEKIIKEIEKPKIKNPQLVEEYFDEIYDTLKSTELEHLPEKDYMSKRTDITSKMRSILLDWLVEVHMKYKLKPETLYITTNIIDRYLSIKDIKRTKLQLVGVTSMFIASKYEDIYPPEVSDFAYITDNAYTKKEILKMEIDILSTLNFNITFPTQYKFIEIYKRILNFDDKTFCFSWYCLELCLIDYKMIKYKPSFLAACAVFCAYRLLDLDERGVPEKLGFCYAEMKSCCLEICGLIDDQKRSNLRGIYKKFSLEKYYKIAHMKF